MKQEIKSSSNTKSHTVGYHELNHTNLYKENEDFSFRECKESFNNDSIKKQKVNFVDLFNKRTIELYSQEKEINHRKNASKSNANLAKISINLNYNRKCSNNTENNAKIFDFKEGNIINDNTQQFLKINTEEKEEKYNNLISDKVNPEKERKRKESFSMSEIFQIIEKQETNNSLKSQHHIFDNAFINGYNGVNGKLK